MKGMFKKEFLEARGKLIWGLVVFCLLAIGIPLLYPLVVSLTIAPVPADAISAPRSGISVAMPGEILKEIERMRRDFDYYLWSQWAGKNLPQAGGVLAIILGMGTVANEYKRKTALFLLARPISRAGILGNKFAAAIISLAVVIFVSTLVMLAAARLAGYHFAWGTQLASAVPSFAGAVLIFAVTAFFSSFSPGALPAALGGLGATVLSVLTPYFFKSNALNILFHMAGARFFQEGVFPWPFILASFVLTVVFYCLALLVFSRHEAL